jgi:hypothetical protein
MTPKPANSKRESTAGYGKSTVDLGAEPLIQGKNGLPAPFLLDYRHSFSPVTTGKLWNAGQMQTDAGQKMKSSPHCSLNEKAGAQRQNKINYPPLIYG